MPTPHRRLPAEWEPQSTVQLTFPHPGTDWKDVLDDVMPCFLEIAATISRFQKVLIVSHNAMETRDLVRGNLENYHICQVPSNDTWARDHGGITIFEDGRPVVLDFVFNGWGMKFPANLDNLITGRLDSEHRLFDAEVRKVGLVLEGGAIESDGQGTLLTTAECMLSPNRNPHLSKDEIETQLKSLFGLGQVLWLHHGYLAGDDTDSHVDTLARFCSPDTIAYVRCDDPADEHFHALKQMETELRHFKTLSGKPYNLAPLPWPDACHDKNGERLPATYANFLIINGAVLAPTYQVPQDEQALQTIQSLFPDRKVIGIDCKPLILQHGSLHCVTMQYPQKTQRFPINK